MKKNYKIRKSPPNIILDNYYQLNDRTDILHTLKSITRLCGILAFIIGTLALTGWIYDYEVLKSVITTFPSMKANTAIALTLLGSSLLLSQISRTNPIYIYLQRLSALITVTIGAFTLSQYITGIDIGIDQLFFTEPAGELGTASPNRMAPNSALLFILLGSALLFLDKKIFRFWVTHILTIVASIILLPTLIGYIYSIEFIYGLATTTKMAVHTSMAFLALVIGIFLSRPQNGFTSLLIKDDAGGYLARRMTLTGIIIPLCLGWLIFHGYLYGFYDANFRYLFLIGSCVILFTTVIWKNASSLSSADEKRKKAEAFLSHMAAIVKASDDAIISRTLDGKVLSWNRGAEKIYGYTFEEMKNNNIKILLPKGRDRELENITKKLTKGKHIDHLQTMRIRKDGKPVYVSISISPIKDQNGNISAISTITRNITQEKNAEKLLEMRIRQQAVVAELGKNALSGKELKELYDLATKKLAEVLDVEYTKILELNPDNKSLVLRSGVGWNKDVKIDYSTVDTGKNSQAGFTLISKKPVIVKNLSKETRFRGPPLLTDHQVVSGISCIIQGKPKPYGVLGVHSKRKKDFTPQDINFLLAVANLLAMTIERKQLERQKDDFISIASHELKTPVTSIKSYGQVLQLKFQKDGNKNATELLKKMDTQLNKLTNLIGDLLDVTKIQTGKLQYNNQIFNFDDLVKELIEEIQRTSRKHTIVLKGSTQQEIFGDRDRISQVLTNLISNAIKYSPDKGEIIVHSSLDKSNIRLCVQDFGVGIAKEKQNKIFERFFRISGPGKDTYPGLGLGLYISSEIIKRQGGRIWVESQEGLGSSFCFTLPKRSHFKKNSKRKKVN